MQYSFVQMNGQIYLIRPDGTDLKRCTPGGKDNNWLPLNARRFGLDDVLECTRWRGHGLLPTRRP